MECNYCGKEADSPRKVEVCVYGVGSMWFRPACIGCVVSMILSVAPMLPVPSPENSGDAQRILEWVRAKTDCYCMGPGEEIERCSRCAAIDKLEREMSA